VVFAALGLGSLTGALLTPRLLRVFRPGSLIIGCVLTGGTFTALLAVLLGRVVVATRLIAFMMVPVAPVVGGAMLGATGKFWPVVTVSAAVQIGVALLALCTPPRRVTAPEPGPAPEPAQPDAAAT
jgi:hypothetical protein